MGRSQLGGSKECVKERDRHVRGDWADRGGLGGLVPVLMDSWAST